MRWIGSWVKAVAQQRGFAAFRKWVGAIAIVLCVFLWSCSNPVQAVDKIDPKFKEQVLQVIRENPEVILDSVRDYQKKQQKAAEDNRQAFLQTLKTKPNEVIGLSPLKGAKNSKVLLIEFSDFQCPYCAKAHETLNQLLPKYSTKLALVYKYLPLTSIHPEAMPSAKAAWAAGQQGKFWEYHDALFTNQDQLGEDLYKSIAQSLKLNMQKFESDRASNAAESAIDQDVKMAEKIGVDGTPFFLVSGAKFVGPIQLQDLDGFLAQGNS
jgi:protein-disulfide isomerase